MIRKLLTCVVVLLALECITSASELFDFQPLATGVYVAIARPTFRTNCNSVIVLMSDGVLVVDTESKPSAAREVINFIKQKTNRPVRYIVLTHFHADHTQGAAEYVKEWPEVEIVSSDVTRDAIALKGRARLAREHADVPKQIGKLQQDMDKTSDPKEKERIEKTIREAKEYYEESDSLQIASPTITVKDSLVLQHGLQTIEIHWLGKAHTDGDLFVFLPQQKILITGDSLQSLTPTMRDSFPADWIETLWRAERFDFQIAVGGHGEPMHGKSTIVLWQHYFADVLEQAGATYAAGKSFPDSRLDLINALYPLYKDKFPERFKDTIVSNVEKGYRIAGGITE
jgi:cyclase